MTPKVGIIANPASGRDIRRLVAHASVFDNMEKVSIVRRLILGLESTGVDEILIMPDTFDMGYKALDGLPVMMRLMGQRNLNARVLIMDMPVTGTQDDSTRAAQMLNRLKVGCIIVVGGDGTNRAVAKGCGDTPILPVSTGTNNVIPYMIEGTVAGLAAGLVAQKIVSNERHTTRLKKLHIIKNGEWIDVALVDAVVTDDLFVGARALWDVSTIKQVITTRGEPYNIGMSSIVGSLHPISISDNQGFHLKMGEGGLRVRAPIAPGLVMGIEVLDFGVLNINDKVEVSYKPSMVALDGEREVEVYDKDFVEVKLCKDGPLIVDIERVLGEAVKKEIFVSR